MWEGRTVAVLASGPSMSAKVADRVRAAGLPTVVTNDTWRLAPWADVLYAADRSWWEHYWKEVEPLPALKVGCEPGCKLPGVNWMRDTGREGFDPNPSCIRTGGNSGYQAIHLAAHAGARYIVLCGFDMHGAHWHGRHPDPLRNAGPGMFDKWVPRFATLERELSARGVRVVNCTPGTALRYWPCFDLDTVLESVRTLEAA
jgi:hypothetical protein